MTLSILLDGYVRCGQILRFLFCPQKKTGGREEQLASTSAPGPARIETQRLDASQNISRPCTVGGLEQYILPFCSTRLLQTVLFIETHDSVTISSDCLAVTSCECRSADHGEISNNDTLLMPILFAYGVDACDLRSGVLTNEFAEYLKLHLKSLKPVLVLSLALRCMPLLPKIFTKSTFEVGNPFYPPIIRSCSR